MLPLLMLVEAAVVLILDIQSVVDDGEVEQRHLRSQQRLILHHASQDRPKEPVFPTSRLGQAYCITVATSESDPCGGLEGKKSARFTFTTSAVSCSITFMSM